MGRLQVLHLEDSAADADLIATLLRSDGLDCDLRRVETQVEFEAALDLPELDLIISDYTLPGFDGLAALQLARARRPEVPFLFVSGTIGDERAVESLKGGASDFVIKNSFARLAPAVRRALDEARERASLREAEEALRRSEERYSLDTSAVQRIAPSEKKKDAAKIAVPAAGGAIIGGIVGGGQGAAIGGAVGGGAGTALVLTDRGQEVRFGKGAALTVKLARPLVVRVGS